VAQLHVGAEAQAQLLLRETIDIDNTPMRHTRITVVTPFFPNSREPYRGSSTYQLVRRLAAFADVNVICPLPRYPQWLQPRSFDYRRANLDYRLPDVNVQYIEFPAVPIVTRAVNGMVCTHYLLDHIRSLAPDLILNYWLYPQGYAAVEVGTKLGIPIIVGSIGTDLNAMADPVTRFFTRLTLQRATLVVTKSHHMRHEAIRLGADPIKVHAVLNGCDTTIFRISDRRQARAELNVGPAEQLIVYVGRLELTKGVLELVEAFATLRRRNRGVQLAFVGDGPRQAMIGEHAHAHGVAEHVRFVPPETPWGVSRWLAAANLLALPSYAEGCPNVVLEATSCGRPVVATNVGGIPEIVDERCAVLIPPHDVAALVTALEMALDRDWNELMIASRFRRSWEDMAGELYDICLSALPNRAVQPQSRALSTQHA
jgi:teichuronic acid biosynthesis glycosyltransferase TuaC